jgi:hypothetical protein
MSIFRREFTVMCKAEDYDETRILISKFWDFNIIGHAGGHGILNSNILVKEFEDDELFVIWFRCKRGLDDVCLRALNELEKDKPVLLLMVK